MNKYRITFYSYNGELQGVFEGKNERQAILNGMAFFFRSRVEECDVKSIEKLNK